jgi:hypothetical protein
MVTIKVKNEPAKAKTTAILSKVITNEKLKMFAFK